MFSNQTPPTNPGSPFPAAYFRRHFAPEFMMQAILVEIRKEHAIGSSSSFTEALLPDPGVASLRERTDNTSSDGCALGGAGGAGVRWAVLQQWHSSATFAWPVFVINVAGSFLLGCAMGSEWRRPRLRTLLHDGVGIGFCGGLTTFSTLSVETARALSSGHLALGALSLLTSLTCSVAAIFAGALLVRRSSALADPLEAKP